jgi:hypothetical protein
MQMLILHILRPEIRAKLEKKNWGSILNDIIDYRVHVLLQILTIFHELWHLFHHYCEFFAANMCLYRAPAGW